MIDARLRHAYAGFALDVSLELPSSGISVLFGSSGCGKTTVLRALAGLLRAEGRIALGGEVWQDDALGVFVPTHRRALGYVIQGSALFPHLDVRANLDFGARRSAPSEQRIAIDQAVALLGIGPLMSRRTQTLSGGERQRVAIARALAAGPRLLLMDEPLAALDAARKDEILPYLERLHRELSLPVVYVTHSMDEVARLADHLVMLQAGQVLAAGSPVELLSRLDLAAGEVATGRHEAGVVLDAEIVEHDEAFGMMRVGFGGGSLWVGAAGRPLGERVRARVLARDVSVVRQAPGETSILNVLPVVLVGVQTDRNTVLLRLRMHDRDARTPDGVHLLARITRKSCDILRLREGDALFAQIKGVALM